MAMPISLKRIRKLHGGACGGMGNRIVHGYFDINLEVVWETVQTALPELLSHYLLRSSMLHTKTATTMG
ncbi:HepT-like ribonuclease domain-containing protein [Paenalcaligenes niemegkensis]|uniref:HepT-like ribonuclease domain-containing protein n=1 Tax=Paenalcaligenes niemegkensis TaxID=2895469 RepID=UPI0040279DBC